MSKNDPINFSMNLMTNPKQNSATIHIKTLCSFKGFGSGSYGMTSVKKLKGTACSTNIVTKLPTQADCILFVLFFFQLLSVLYLLFVFSTLCLCTFEPIKTFIDCIFVNFSFFANFYTLIHFSSIFLQLFQSNFLGQHFFLIYSVKSLKRQVRQGLILSD